MVRILHVYPQLNNAGTENVIMNLYRNIDRSKVQFDFLVERTGELDLSINQMGGRIFYLYAKASKEYYKNLMKFFAVHQEYQIVHTHTHARMGLVLKAAKKNGIPCRIAHSHNARTDLPDFAKIYKKVTSRAIEKYATDFFACSNMAAKWLFPTKYTDCHIIRNAIELERFQYEDNNRTYFRKEYGIANEITIICHVGRFAMQKNHSFFVEAAKEIISTDADTLFVLVGTGPLMQEIKDKVNSCNIKEHFLFLGNRTDVEVILSASDIFVLPSLYEGLGIVLIEAQANGLPCIASDGVPDEADMGNGLLQRLPLSRGASFWADRIMETYDKKVNRKELSHKVSDDYNIRKSAQAVQDFYIKNKGEV